jgi:hypothetical protein
MEYLFNIYLSCLARKNISPFGSPGRGSSTLQQPTTNPARFLDHSLTNRRFTMAPRYREGSARTAPWASEEASTSEWLFKISFNYNCYPHSV